MQSRSVFILALFLILGAIWMFSRENETDWYPYYESAKKSPYGTYVLNTCLPDMFSGEIKKETNSNWLEDALENNTSSSYLFVGREFNPSNDFQEKLQRLVAEGSNTLITAQYFSSSFLRTLHVGKESATFGLEYVDKKRNLQFTMDTLVDLINGYFYLLEPETIEEVEDADNPDIVEEPEEENNPEDTIEIISLESSYVTPIEELVEMENWNSMEVLAEDDYNRALFIKISWGKGNFYLLSTPQVFSNIALLDTAFNAFSFGCLSYLPEKNTLHLQERFYDDTEWEGESRSIFDVMKSRADLRMVYYLVIALLLLFVVFRSKRKQRIIPNIEALRNTSLDFLQALTNLYYAKKDYRSVLMKRYAFLLDDIRDKYYINTEILDGDFELRLSLKTGVSPKLIQQLFDRFKCVEQAKSISIELFMECNKLLEQFYALSKEHRISKNEIKSV